VTFQKNLRFLRGRKVASLTRCGSLRSSTRTTTFPVRKKKKPFVLSRRREAGGAQRVGKSGEGVNAWGLERGDSLLANEKSPGGWVFDARIHQKKIPVSTKVMPGIRPLAQKHRWSRIPCEDRCNRVQRRMMEGV